jgi:SAM domain (Sterile alpha motif)
MKGIAEWLASIGLSEYAQRFAENAIDLSVLRDLTEQDLKDLGVLLGHRRKILRAIVELDGVTGEGEPDVAGRARPNRQAALPAAGTQRRGARGPGRRNLGQYCKVAASDRRAKAADGNWTMSA